MGKAKELYMEMREEERDKRLASTLGITFDELNCLQWDLNTNESEDGLVYGYILEFDESSPKEILNKIEGLEDGCRVWLSPWEFEDDEYENDPTWYHDTPYSQYYDFFKSSVREVENMLKVEGMDASQHGIFLRLLFVQAVIIMETYLGDTLKAVVFQEKDKLIKLLEFDEEMKKTKLTLADIVKDPNAIKDKVSEHLSELMYHNLAKIGILYKGILEIEFNFGNEENKKKLFQAIKTRHDCVHRNGKTKEGDQVSGINEQYVEEILSIIEYLVDDIEDKITNAKGATA